MCICPECRQVNVFDKKNNYGIKSWQCKTCLTELLENDEVVKTNIKCVGRKQEQKEIEGQLSLWEI